MGEPKMKLNVLDAFGLSDDSSDDDSSECKKSTISQAKEKEDLNADVEMAPAQIDFTQLSKASKKRDSKFDYKIYTNSFDKYPRKEVSYTDKKKPRKLYRNDYRDEHQNNYDSYNENRHRNNYHYSQSKQYSQRYAKFRCVSY